VKQPTKEVIATTMNLCMPLVLLIPGCIIHQKVSVDSDLNLHHLALQSFEVPGWLNELGS